MNQQGSYDVVIIGGAFSGAATGWLIKRRLPDARVAIIERAEAFDRKVGEATVEVSSFFLHSVLGLYDELSRFHLPKHGLRFWFSDNSGRDLTEMSEVGPAEAPRLPAFQLDRERLDEMLIARAEAAGCEVFRPARVRSVETGWPSSEVEIQVGKERSTLTAKWVVDASGKACFLAKKLGLWERIEVQNTAAVWSRFEGALDFDDHSLYGSGKLDPLVASRRLATNHICGRGYWCWIIPLADGQTSVGIVYEKSLFQLPGEGTMKERFLAFLRQTDGLKQLIADAEMVDEDFTSLGHLAYRSKQYQDRGWALVGDSAAFIDPFYSPGLDHAAISVTSAVNTIAGHLEGTLCEKGLEDRLEEYNARYERSYHRWRRSLYEGKYEILGDAELTAASFLLDTALYYMGVVSPVYADEAALDIPMFGLDNPPTNRAYRFIRFYNQRLAKLARKRIAKGIYGQRNLGWSLQVPSFALGLASLKHLRLGLRLWLIAELRTMFARSRKPAAKKAAMNRPAHVG